MFSSNQILQVTGSLHHKGELEAALKFALEFGDHTKGKKVFQITETGKYCLGWMYQEVPKGWSEYQFEFTPEIGALIITQFLENQDIEYGEWDGSYDKGFLMEDMSEDNDDVENSFYGIVSFQPYTVFYHK